jgi:hypothetical protein
MRYVDYQGEIKLLKKEIEHFTGGYGFSFYIEDVFYAYGEEIENFKCPQTVKFIKHYTEIQKCRSIENMIINDKFQLCRLYRKSFYRFMAKVIYGIKYDLFHKKTHYNCESLITRFNIIRFIFDNCYLLEYTQDQYDDGVANGTIKPYIPFFNYQIGMLDFSYN